MCRIAYLGIALTMLWLAMPIAAQPWMRPDSNDIVPLSDIRMRDVCILPDEDIWMPLWLAALMVGEHLNNFIGQRQGPPVQILDEPRPRLLRILVGRDGEGLGRPINIRPRAVE